MLRATRLLLWLQEKPICFMATSVLMQAEDHKVDCGSYKVRLRFTRLSLIAEGVG